jgi:hypothetical protein
MAHYTNYRWEPVNVRKGDRFHYKCDVVWPYTQWRTAEQPQVIATVTYDDKHTSPYWGKWHATIHPLSPQLNALRKSDIPKFTSKEDAIAWVTAMVRFSI